MPGYVVSNLDPVPMSELKGILYYRFKDDLSSKTTIQSSQVSNQDISMQANTQMYGGGTPDNMLYNKDNTSLGDAKPLAGKKISLVVTYIFSGNHWEECRLKTHCPKKHVYAQKDIAGADQVLATTTTGRDGSFNLVLLMQKKTLGLFKGDYAFLLLVNS
ncbi:MAG: hypothetical protein IPQ27_04790 [Chitinophagaceae bacterium]|nr:hypothetical protein [Chitinophagaceae bacterium]